jgi:hypothetical protein
MARKIRTRRGLSSLWISVNPTLMLGEAGLETDTKRVKYGDGVSVWTDLPYQKIHIDDVLGLSSDVEEFLGAETAEALREVLELGTAALVDTGTTEGTIPTLSSGGKIAKGLLPSIAISETLAVANAASRLALSLSDAQGKIVVQTDNGKSYGLILNGVPANANDWLQLGDNSVVASDITDSTSDGRTLLTAANKAAQREHLELGTIATEDVSSFVRQDPFSVGSVSGDVILNRDNGPWQVGYASASINILAPTSSSANGNSIRFSFHTNGGPYDLNFDSAIQMTPAAFDLLPIELEEDRAYIIELQNVALGWILKDISGPYLTFFP